MLHETSHHFDLHEQPASHYYYYYYTCLATSHDHEHKLFDAPDLQLFR